jgi:hypothetical protein
MNSNKTQSGASNQARREGQGGQGGGQDPPDANRKVCGRPCPRCNNPDIGYCITLQPPVHSDPNSCGNCGLAW